MTDRRHFLAGLAAATAALAGCGGSGDGAAATDDAGPDSSGDASATPTAGTEDGTATADSTETATTTDGGGPSSPTPALDLREANVVGVAVGDEGGGEYRFDVTLYHDDEGEDGYANWWQVETLDGEQLGRRDLVHAHGTQEFTRSATVSVPDGTSCVAVRGHDQTHEYGGQAMLVSLPGGATNAVRQGAEPDDFADESCP
ncbi:hypothetical protein [Halomicrobium salinisoli]|uniref:hypothetical protein n=1 Tax=Halomicrobium salinisoli TaxID=2878391 RepID=UPI001CF0BBC1|nr:hypothetical protein [Halomicrobium salinisoli]